MILCICIEHFFLWDPHSNTEGGKMSESSDTIILSNLLRLPHVTCQLVVELDQDFNPSILFNTPDVKKNDEQKFIHTFLFALHLLDYTLFCLASTLCWLAIYWLSVPNLFFILLCDVRTWIL